MEPTVIFDLEKLPTDTLYSFTPLNKFEVGPSDSMVMRDYTKSFVAPLNITSSKYVNSIIIAFGNKDFPFSDKHPYTFIYNIYAKTGRGIKYYLNINDNVYEITSADVDSGFASVFINSFAVTAKPIAGTAKTISGSFSKNKEYEPVQIYFTTSLFDVQLTSTRSYVENVMNFKTGKHDPYPEGLNTANYHNLPIPGFAPLGAVRLYPLYDTNADANAYAEAALPGEYLFGSFKDVDTPGSEVIAYTAPVNSPLAASGYNIFSLGPNFVFISQAVELQTVGFAFRFLDALDRRKVDSIRTILRISIVAFASNVKSHPLTLKHGSQTEYVDCSKEALDAIYDYLPGTLNTTVINNKTEAKNKYYYSQHPYFFTLGGFGPYLPETKTVWDALVASVSIATRLIPNDYDKATGAETGGVTVIGACSCPRAQNDYSLGTTNVLIWVIGILCLLITGVVIVMSIWIVKIYSESKYMRGLKNRNGQVLSAATFVPR